MHLIDFEQLKIENQTLNEKIEDRNEENHKLRKKVTQTVIILSHTREKAQYVAKQTLKEAERLNELSKQLNKYKNQLSELKKKREMQRKVNQKLKQQTGIVNDKWLTQDYNERQETVKQLRSEIEQLKAHHEHLTSIIEEANRAQMRAYAHDG